MKITRIDFEKYAGELRDFFHDRNIKTIGCLERHLWSRFPVEGEKNHFITVSSKPHKDGERAYAINYIITKPQELSVTIPIEVRINPESNYSTIVAKLDHRMGEYNIFYMDENNILQEKVIRNSDIDRIKQELSSLCDAYAYLQ